MTLIKLTCTLLCSADVQTNGPNDDRHGAPHQDTTSPAG
jgi:hypothetical protein